MFAYNADIVWKHIENIFQTYLELKKNLQKLFTYVLQTLQKCFSCVSKYVQIKMIKGMNHKNDNLK